MGLCLDGGVTSTLGVQTMHQELLLRKAQMWLATAMRYDSGAVTTGDPEKDERLKSMAFAKACELELMGLGHIPCTYEYLWDPAIKEAKVVSKYDISAKPKAIKPKAKNNHGKDRGRILHLPM